MGFMGPPMNQMGPMPCGPAPWGYGTGPMGSPMRPPGTPWQAQPEWRPSENIGPPGVNPHPKVEVKSSPSKPETVAGLPATKPVEPVKPSSAVKNKIATPNTVANKSTPKSDSAIIEDAKQDHPSDTSESSLFVCVKHYTAIITCGNALRYFILDKSGF